MTDRDLPVLGRVAEHEWPSDPVTSTAGLVHPSMACWTCGSRNVSSTDHDGHGAAEHIKPEDNGRFTVRCEDCSAVWQGQLRRVA